jgi:hypothetical protein
MDQAFCEVENTDPAQHEKWLAKHGFAPDENGNFLVSGYEGKLPVETEKLFDNIRANVTSMWYESLYSLPYDDRTFVMVCGGPSLAEHLEEIRAKSLDPNYLVVCSNMTGAYLRSHGITPNVHFVIDPQPKKRFDVANASKDTQYWINAACDPAVFEELKSQDIKPYAFLADFESEGRAVKAIQESMYPGQAGMMAIQGGTMAGLRAMNLADALGFRKMEYYGFDATVRIFDGKAQPYAYEKKRGEAIIQVDCPACDAKFDTTLVFQKQVAEFIQWRENMPWMDVTIIGGGLIDHCWKHAEEHAEKKKSDATYRFTPGYAELQRQLHAHGHYGVSGKQFIPTIFHGISQLYKRLGRVTVLDYGSARGDTMKAVREHLHLPRGVKDYCYDPFVKGMDKEPSPADFVICTDVLEHVEPECTKAVLDHIQSLTKRIAFFSIALTPANKKLADGRNAHINLHDAEFWLKEIRKRFITSEAKVASDDSGLLVVAQSIDDVRNLLREERKAA